ncbi:MAG: amidase [Acidobacteriota bacterium]|nr:amidase [Acidobacteriota bacterium]
MIESEICFLTAIEIAGGIRSKKFSAVEVMAAHLRQVELVNPRVNAIVTLVAEQATAEARRADECLARGEWLGPLHGLPVAHKDLHDTRGIRTTYGSPLFQDHVPSQDALIVERIKRAGAITMGKTNTPEFGAGSQTFNPVFGATRNPYDPTKTCGGSSGGAAVALACGMIPIADGSDMGGSLRNPASFCNVVGLRPAPGRVPSWPAPDGWSSLSVGGPMARTVADTALLLSAMAGPDDRSPISLQEPGDVFARPLDRNFQGVRIAWATGLNGLPIDRRVKEVVDGQRDAFEALGCIVEQAEPDLRGADAVFRALRAWSFELRLGGLDRSFLKDTVLQEIERGARLTGPELSRAEVERTQLYHRVRTFMGDYEFIVLPVTQVPPFDLEQPYVTEIEGVKMDSYIDWMKSCYFISVIGNPAISVPCGFTPEGLPVGLQIVGRHRAEWAVLQMAHAFEQATGFGKRRPSVSYK